LAQWELERGTPQSTREKEHLPIPLIYGKSYHEARKDILELGWQPIQTWWPHHLPELNIEHGNGHEFWNRGYHEIKSTCPTGYAFCRFEFRDHYQNKLAVITAGEEWTERGMEACVVSIFLESDES
jgi:hypothetical protein